MGEKRKADPKCHLTVGKISIFLDEEIDLGNTTLTNIFMVLGSNPKSAIFFFKLQKQAIFAHCVMGILWQQ